MVSLFRTSARDLDTLRSTVSSLRETTVPGLAAALSWRPRKVEKLLIEELTRPGTSMAYDPARRIVRWVPLTSTVWHVPPPAPSAPPVAQPSRPPVDLGPTLSAPPPVVRGNGLKSQCPSCHVPLAASTSPSLTVCPRCGRLFSPRNAPSAVADSARPEPSRTVSSTTTPPGPSSATHLDRRSQELLAAYVTAKPIPCPRCRTALRHRGLSEYGCPKCGEAVRFHADSVVIGDRAGPAPIPASR